MQYPEIKYLPEEEDPSITLETEEIVAKVIDNSGLLCREGWLFEDFWSSPEPRRMFSHRLGCHGIRTFYRKDERRNVVTPFSSWLNLQMAQIAGVKTDPVDERAVFGHGRGWPLQLSKRGRGAALTLQPLPSMQMKFEIEYQPAEPDGIDFSVQFTFGVEADPAKGVSRWGEELEGAVFRSQLPCYINGFNDVSLYYPKGKSINDWEWGKTGEKPDIIEGETVNYRHDQKLYFPHDQAFPLGYGLIGDHVFILMADTPDTVIFTVNAGGHNFFHSYACPAYDIEYLLHDYAVNEPVGFSGRIIYTRFESEKQVFDRYRQWSSPR